MADHYIIIGDVLFPRKHFHSMGLSVAPVKGADGEPSGRVQHVLRINLTEGQGFSVGGEREEVEQAFATVANQLGVSITRVEQNKEEGDEMEEPDNET